MLVLVHAAAPVERAAPRQRCAGVRRRRKHDGAVRRETEAAGSDAVNRHADDDVGKEHRLGKAAERAHELKGRRGTVSSAERLRRRGVVGHVIIEKQPNAADEPIDEALELLPFRKGRARS